jgi:predicted lysophospholipase L1 biosynthesis ABC-type transport system permease subunit
VRESLAALDQELAVIETNTVTALIHESLADERYRTTLLSGFALLAALIAAVGLAGSTLRAFERRRRELCIRLSIGATPARATTTLVGQAGLAVVAGLVLGLLCQWPAGRLLRAQLHGITSMDPIALLLGAAVLLAAAAAAVAAPVRRLWRTDLARVLREL